MQTVSPDVEETKVSRSFLFVPADSERKLAKAAATSADALILDLEDAVSSSERPKARGMAREYLSEHAGNNVWVRINSLDTGDALQDLQEVMPGAPCGIVLPKPEGARDVMQLGKLLDVLEHEHSLEAGSTRILPIVTERPEALFHLHEYASASRRLAGLTWGAEDLSAAVGATANRDEDGGWLPPYQLARSLCLFASAAAQIPAIDTVYTDFRNIEGLTRYAVAARRDGFSGMLAIHPDQVEAINVAFVPSSEEVERAHRIVEMFEESPDVGAQGMDGEMIDRPHLLQARRILKMAGVADNRN
jgi:citrate lyase subunit beta/citryl-CoA lyase